MAMQVRHARHEPDRCQTHRTWRVGRVHWFESRSMQPFESSVRNRTSAVPSPSDNRADFAKKIHGIPHISRRHGFTQRGTSARLSLTNRHLASTRRKADLSLPLRWAKREGIAAMWDTLWIDTFAWPRWFPPKMVPQTAMASWRTAHWPLSAAQIAFCRTRR